MGYRAMARRALWEIYRRWVDGQSVSGIAREEGWDRKTVRLYLKGLAAAGLERRGPAVAQQRFSEIVGAAMPKQPARRSPVRDHLGEHLEELRALIQRDQEPLKPKSAFLVVNEKYELQVSYETFKRFARRHGLKRKKRRRMIRIELPAGKETQLDYGHVGTLADPVSGANRGVWAFCGLLSYSRLPFIEFVRRQDQSEFAGSVVSMVHTYAGATEWISVDNLKAGVIKPDLWDPTINRSLAEVAAYYGIFVNPCRVGKSTDKGKIERMVPVARELFRMLKELHPSATLGELNERALQWCREVYGRKEHGTTGLPPMEAFETERPTLKALPGESYQVAIWKQVSVHPGDQFFSFRKSRFALPLQWRGQRVWVRYAEPLLQVHDDEDRVIRQYVLRPEVRRYWQPEDFPEEVREMMDGGYPAWILQKAGRYGEEAVALLRSVMRPHAYLNARRARGMLDILAAHHGRPYFQEVCRRALRRSVSLPATLRRMMEAAERLPLWQAALPMSPTGAEMVRDVRYYVEEGDE
jgi:transposase